MSCTKKKRGEHKTWCTCRCNAGCCCFWTFAVLVALIVALFFNSSFRETEMRMWENPRCCALKGTFACGTFPQFNTLWGQNPMFSYYPEPVEYYGNRDADGVTVVTHYCCPEGFPAKTDNPQAPCRPVNQTAIPTDRAVKARVVPVNTQHRRFPNDHQLPPRATAAAFSGGGSRAQTASVGELRGLTKLGLMGKVDAVGAVSGGNWCMTPYFFQTKRSVAELLGLGSDADTSPGALTLARLRGAVPALALGPTRWPAIGSLRIPGVLAEVARRAAGSGKNWWVELVRMMVLEPHDLADRNRYLAKDSDAAARITAANPDTLKGAAFYEQQRPAEREQLYCVGGVLTGLAGWVEGAWAGDGNPAYLSMSAEYVGSAFYPRNSTLTYTSVSSDLLPHWLPHWHSGSVDMLVGGGLVETFAFGGDAPVGAAQMGSSVGASDADAPVLTTVGRPKRPFSLVDVVGVSSNALAQVISESFGVASQFAAYTHPYWPVTAPSPPFARAFSGPQLAELFELGDGGTMENFGLLQLLQRGATRAAVFNHGSQRLGVDSATTKEVDFCAIAAGTAGAGEFKSTYIDGTIGGLFGFGGEPKLSVDYSKNQVFPSEEMAPLACAMQTKHRAGEPVVVKSTHALVGNAWWGIEGGGGRTVEVVWSDLQASAAFTELLPAETRAEVAKGANGMFNGFPQYNTYTQLYLSNAQINLMAALQEYAVTSNKELYESLLT